jgi:hypothetical protein
MPAVNLSDLGLADKSPSELESIRLGLVETLRTEYKGYDDPEVPMDLLNKLAVVTSSLRRKNAGPPKVPKTAKASKEKAQTDDFLV